MQLFSFSPQVIWRSTDNICIEGDINQGDTMNNQTHKFISIPKEQFVCEVRGTEGKRRDIGLARYMGQPFNLRYEVAGVIFIWKVPGVRENRPDQFLKQVPV